MTRLKFAEDAVSITYELKDDAGKVMGYDREFKLAPEQQNEQTIRDAARNALQTNRDFIAATKPGTAAGVADAAYLQAKALSRQNNGIIRLLLGLLDGTT